MVQDQAIPSQVGESRQPHAIVVGFGVPGRAVAEALSARGVPFCVIELNSATVQRCRNIVRMIQGDATHPEVLRNAGIEHAALLIVTVPDDKVAVEITKAARQINPRLHIITRCAYTSAGMEAMRAGANQIVIAEQAVARELASAVMNDSSDNGAAF